MSSVVSRLRPRPKARHEGYAFCAEDRYWFRPAYTDGACPLCGEVAPAGAAPTSWLADRSWYGLGLLALESLAMLALVLFMYFKA